MSDPSVNFGDPRLSESFWSRVSPCPVSGCWRWLGNVKKGVPTFSSHQVQVSARRHAYRTLIGPIDRGLVDVCGTSGCCNPQHVKPFSVPHGSWDLKETRRRWNLANKHRYKSYYLKRKYGITAEDLERMLARQDGRCAICKTDFGDSGHHIDHAHDTGRVRALLCMQCNTGIGMFRENTSFLIAAIAYLASHRKADADE